MVVPRRTFLALGGLAAVGLVVERSLSGSGPAAPAALKGAPTETFAVTLSDAQWRKKLSPEQYSVLRHEGTEAPFTSPLDDEHRAGTFSCAGCDQQAYSSATKFDSGTGWPSFWQPLTGAVRTRRDSSLGMVRVEVHCSRCGGHLGHVFDDGPRPTGKRYCMNGVAMTFAPGAARAEPQ